MLVSEVTADAAALLNDPSQITWTNAILLPYYQKAHRELLEYLENNSVPILREVSTLTTVAAGATSITTITDIRTPLTLWERASGSTDTFTLMKETDWEPEENQTTELRYWSWREGIINLLGATADRQVKLLYIKTIDAPVSVSANVAIPEGRLFLTSRTAAIGAALAGGNFERASALDIDSQEALSRCLNSMAKSMQGIPIRRRGYRR
jgi:hypothetical protein